MSAITRILSIDRDNPDPSILDEAASILKRGGLVAFATETVYGLGADATNPDAVLGIFEAKGRPPTNPLIVHADSLEMARTCYRECPPRLESLANRWWPGPITFVWYRSPLIPELVTAGHETVGVRIPVPPVARGLIHHLGRPIAAPSANRSTEISPTRAEHVLKSLNGRIDLILDSGPTDVGIESTIADLTSPEPRILRPGPVSALDLRISSYQGHSPDALPPSPGRMPLHYAPRTPSYWVEPERFGRDGLVGRGGCLVVGRHDLPSLPALACRIELSTPEAAARSLYAVLHEFDVMGLDYLCIVPPPDQPEWQAVRDRLRRATHPKS